MQQNSVWSGFTLLVIQQFLDLSTGSKTNIPILGQIYGKELMPSMLGKKIQQLTWNIFLFFS